MSKTLSKQDLQTITTQTVASYESNPIGFWEGTKDHDVRQNYQALLSAMTGPSPWTILDFGCGPGRDLKYFASLGHRPIGLEASPSFCQMAQDYSGCEVWQQNFLNMDLPPNFFDGIFANASLFHVPHQELLRVLGEFHRALKPDGILFSSNPRGNWEGWNGDRYGHFMEFETYQKYLTQANFKVLSHYYRPKGKPLAEQPWLAVVSQR